MWAQEHPNKYLTVIVHEIMISSDELEFAKHITIDVPRNGDKIIRLDVVISRTNSLSAYFLLTHLMESHCRG